MFRSLGCLISISMLRNANEEKRTREGEQEGEKFLRI